LRTDNALASEVIAHLLINTKFHCHIHKGPSLGRVLSHLITVQTLASYLFEIPFNNIHQCLGIPSDLFSLEFPTKILYACLIPPMRPTYPIWFFLRDFVTPNNILVKSANYEVLQ
jgi:hypothetical protein